MGMYSGQAANALVEGVKGGYDFVDKARRAKEESDLRIEKIEKAKTENKLYNKAAEDALAGPTPDQQKTMALEKEVATMKQATQKRNGVQVSQDLNMLTVANTSQSRDAAIQTVVAKMKADPASYSALNIKDPGSIRTLNPNSQTEMKQLDSYLGAQGVTPEQYGMDLTNPVDRKNWEAFRSAMVEQIPAVYADNHFVDLTGLGASVGSQVQATPQQTEMLEMNAKNIRKSANSILGPTKSERDEGAYYDDKTGNIMYNDYSPATKNPGSIEQVDDKLDSAYEAGRDTLSPEEQAQVAGAEEMIGQVRNEPDTVANRPEAQAQPTQAQGSAVVNVANRLKEKEGFRAKAYKDAGGHSIGYGHFIKPGEEHLMNATLTEEEASKLLAQDTKSHIDAFTKKEGWTESLNENQKAAVYDMAYNMGPDWMDKFPSVRKALQEGDTAKAAEIIKGSKYAKQVGKRADENASLLTSDVEANIPSGQAPAEVQDEVSKVVSTGQPADDMQMRKIYSLLGKTYPRDPNEMTSDIKNAEFLMKNGVSKEDAISMIYGDDKTSYAPSRYGKLVQEQAQYKKGSPEWQGYEDRKDVLKAGTKSELDRNRWQKELEAPSTTPERQEELKTLIENSMDTAAIQTKKDKVTTMVETRQGMAKAEREVANYNKTGEEISAESVESLKSAQTKLHEYAPSRDLTADGEVIKPMRANQVASQEITSALNRFAPGGDLEAMEQGVVANAAQWVSTKVDQDYIPEDRKDIVEANIRSKSVLGYLQATLIRAMSGTAASEAEVARLQGVMQGSNWNDKEAVKIALDEFRSGLGRQQETLRGQLRVSPYDSYQLSAMGQLNTSGKNGKGKIVGRNEATGEVMYEDGTVEKAK